MTEPILSQRILDAYDELTRRERRLADLLLEDLDTLVLKSATEISEKAGVLQGHNGPIFQASGLSELQGGASGGANQGRRRRPH